MRDALGIGSRLAAAMLMVACAGAMARPVGAQSRTLTRDPGLGGPAIVDLSAMGPLYDGELAEALLELGRERSARAVEELPAALAAAGDDSPDGLFMAYGYALHLAGEHAAAVEVLSRCADEAPLYSDYCHYWAAQSSLSLGQPSAAEAYAGLVEATAVFGPRSRFLRGRAAAADGRHEVAVERFEEFLNDYPGAFYRDDVEFALAESYEALDRAADAAGVYRRVALLNPDSAAERRAEEGLARLRDELGREATTVVRTDSEVVERASVLFDRHRSDEVIALLAPVVERERPGGPTYCEAAYLMGKSYTKLRDHAESLPSYERVLEHCEDEELIVKALYNAGRGAWNVDDDDRALGYFRRLWTDHAASTYADDALLLAARVELSRRRGEEADALLRQQIASFGEGDMLGEAVWLLAKSLFDAGDLRGVVRFVDDQGSRTGEADLYSRGRLSYFRARALEGLSLSREARNGYVEVVRDNPMTYYALLALNRLRDLDAASAEALVAELRAGRDGGPGTIELRPAELARDPAFRRGVELLRMGLYSLAENEFDAVDDRYPNEEEVGWVVSLLYHRAGAFERSHRVPGGRMDLRLDYPTAANLERWQIAYPMPFGELVQGAAAEREIDPYWIYAIMRSESGFRPEIESWANARGLLQLMEGTANDMARLTGRGTVGARELFDPAVNVELGTMFIRTLSDRFGAHPFLVFAGYNGGQGNVSSWLSSRGGLPVDEWVEAIPFDQTRNYVKGVSTSYWVYAWIYGGRPLVEVSFDLSEI